MFRPRVIPCLLLKDKGLVKTEKFSNPKYVGDPINAVKIFNDKEADELIFLDITASSQNRLVSLDLVEKIGDECLMPFAVGGGISSVDDIAEILKRGAEKVSINTSSVKKPELVREAAEMFGSQSIVVCIDVKKVGKERYEVFIYGGRKGTGLDPVEHAKKMERLGAGEIIINSIDRDGTMKGYDLHILKRVAGEVQVPVIACGGAGSLQDLSEVIKETGVMAAAAGSLFVFKGKFRAVLINYPNRRELDGLLGVEI